MILERIASPRDLKRLARPDIDRLAAEIRERLV
jgi:deoxyxylulose-5-phosphate synthase